MQIVIDIPDNDYYDILQCVELKVNTEFENLMIVALKNGIPLPKGHGRLKDIDKIISDGRSKGFCDWYDEMKYADTIIEADKESEEE